jgi:hypothetical protein
MAKTKPPKYRWDGGPRRHTVSQQHHEQNLAAKSAGIDPRASLTAPLTAAQALQQASGSANAVYGPNLRAAQSLYDSAPSWYDNYRRQVAQQQQSSRTYAQSVLAPFQAAGQAAPQLPAGLASTSPEAQRAMQSAQAQQSLGQASYNALAAIPVASDAYFAGLQTSSVPDQRQAQTYLGQQVAGIQSDRAAKTAENFGNIRDAERNYRIAASTLDLNRSNSAFDNAVSVGIDPTTGKPLPTKPEKPEAPYTSGAFAGLTPAQVRGLSGAARQKKIDAYNDVVHPPKPATTGLTPAQQRAAAKEREKHKTAVHAAVGKVRNKIADIMADWAHGGTVDVTDAMGNVTGTRKATRSELRGALAEKYGSIWVGIMENVRGKRPLTKEQIDYLHDQDPNFRIPREWVQAVGQAQNPHATGKRPTKAPGGAHGHI